ncbi:MAG: HAD family hydrolase [Coriobacteriales bacterium]|nr:HAD family hydrolase [Coriobacteriales bacterium]
MYRIVATDMDETFLAFDHTVPQANVDAILRMREQGVLFVPASGRAYGSIMGSLRDLPPACLEGSYVISYNGGCINRVGEDEPLVCNRIAFQTVEALFDYAVFAGDLGMHIYGTDGTVWGWNLTDSEVAYLDGHMDIQQFEGDSIAFLRDVPLSKCLYVYEDLDLLHELELAMDPQLTQGLSTTFSSGRYYEFNPAGVDKGAGLRALAELLDVPLAQTIACGDSANDIAMIEAAGVGVTVSNATPDAMAAASYHARSCCTDGVFAEVWERFIAPQAHA